MTSNQTGLFAGKIRRSITAVVTMVLLVIGLACQQPSGSASPLARPDIKFVTHTATSVRQSAQESVTTTPEATPSPIVTPSVTNKALLTPTLALSSTVVQSPTIHIITAGDTLLDLALSYDLPLAAIEAANPNLVPTNLQIGQAVFIPESDGQHSADAAKIWSPTPPVAVDYAAMERDMLLLVNQERASRNVTALVPDAALRAVARKHATDMAERQYFDHVTPEGATLRDRLRRAGIVKNWVGENIQVNTLPPRLAAAEAMRWFVDSEPHLNNILAEPFTRLGVGVAEGPPGWYVFVLVFAGET